MLRRRRRLVLGRRKRVLLKRPVAPVMFHVSGDCAAMLGEFVEEVLAAAGIVTQRICDGNSRWEKLTRVVKAGVYGHATILCGEPSAGDRLLLPVSIWGEPIRLNAPITGVEILKQYYLAAHRWYIDDPVMARQVTDREETIAVPCPTGMNS